MVKGMNEGWGLVIGEGYGLGVSGDGYAIDVRPMEGDGYA